LESHTSIYTLHRYYIWANKLRTDFYQVLGNHVPSDIVSTKSGFEELLYMSYWYASLYVVIEGWRDLNLNDSKIDILLSSPNVDLLKRYRNGVFHFQKNYFDNRFSDLIVNGINVVEWITELNREFGRFFLEWSKKQLTLP